MAEKLCPVCTKRAVLWYGPESKFAVIGDEPEEDDYELGYPFFARSGKILRAELARQGLDFQIFRRGNLRVHPKAKKDDKCLEISSAKAIRELSKVQAVILLGADVTKFFTGFSIEDTAGLRVEDKITLFQAKLAVPVPKMTVIFTDGFGEIRLALKRFALHAEALGLT